MICKLFSSWGSKNVSTRTKILEIAGASCPHNICYTWNTHTHTRFEQLLELIVCVLEYREASAESALWKPSSADCALTSCDLLVFVRLCVFVVLMTFFLFSLDDLPMGTVGRRPSSEFLLCGGWVWHHWYGSLTMHYNAFTHACLLASNVKQGL